MSPAQETLLDKVKNQHKNFLTGYFVGGDPSIQESIQLMKDAVEKGLDAIEIGIPSRNPFLEGDVIRRAHNRTIDHFHSEEQYVHFLTALRAEIDVPIWIMGYAEEIVHSHLYKKFSQNKLADGFILPDLTLTEVVELKKELGNQLIPVVNDGMDDVQLKLALEGSSIVYCQIYKGKTGSEIKSLSSLPGFFKRLRGFTDAALMAGFGIKNAVVVKQVMNAGFDGVVVGSEIVRVMEEENRSTFAHFIQELASCKESGEMNV